MVHSRTPNIRGGNHGDLENLDFHPRGVPRVDRVYHTISSSLYKVHARLPSKL